MKQAETPKDDYAEIDLIDIGIRQQISMIMMSAVINTKSFQEGWKILGEIGK